MKISQSFYGGLIFGLIILSLGIFNFLKVRNKIIQNGYGMKGFIEDLASFFVSPFSIGAGKDRSIIGSFLIFLLGLLITVTTIINAFSQ